MKSVSVTEHCLPSIFGLHHARPHLEMSLYHCHRLFPHPKRSFISGQWPCTPAGLPSTSGTTSSVCFIMNNKAYIGHVGDSRIVLGRKNKETGMWIPHALTQDHKPESPEEKERIEKAGGEVSKTSRSGAERVVWFRPKQGHRGPVRRSTSFEKIPFLAVARSLGDLWSYNPDTGCYVVSPEPDVSVVPLDLNQDKCLVLASDGLWNMLMDYESVRMVQELEEPDEVKKLLLKSLGPELCNSIKNPSEALVEFAVRKWSRNLLRADNTSAITILLSPRNESASCVTHNECKNSWTPGKQVIIPDLECGPRSFELSINHDQFYLDKTYDTPTSTISDCAKVVGDISYSNGPATSHVSNVPSLSNATDSSSLSKVSIRSDVNTDDELNEKSCHSMVMKSRTNADFTVFFELDEDCISDSADEGGLRMNKACLVLEPLVDVVCPPSNRTVPKESTTGQLKSSQPVEAPVHVAAAIPGPSPSITPASSSNNATNNGVNLLTLPKVSPLTENVMKIPKSLGSVMSNQLDKIHMVTRSAVQKRRQNKWYMNTANLPQNEHHLQLTNKPKRLRSASRYSRAGLGLARSICKAFTHVTKSRTHRTRQGTLK